MHFLYFRVTGEHLIPSEVSKMLNMVPDFSFKKDDVRYIKNEIIVYSEGCWQRKFEIPDDHDIDTMTYNFICELLPYAEIIITLTKKYSVTLWITFYPEIYQFNFRFSQKTITALCSLGIDMDVLIMCLHGLYENIV